MTKEQELLLMAISLDWSKVERLRQLISDEPDWSSLLRIANRQGILPLFSQRILTAGNGLIPAHIIEQLDQALSSNSQNNLRLTWKLVECIEYLAQHGIECIVLKGPVFALQAFGELGLRQFTDLDILIHEADFPQAYDLLERAGYTVMDKLDDRQKKYQVWSGNQYSFGKQGDIIEIHWGIAPQENTRPLDPMQMWQGVRSLQVLDKNISAPSEENTILFTCLHGAKHGWRQLKWIVDLAYICKDYPETAILSILDDAKKMGFHRQVCLGLLLAENLVGVKFTQKLNEKINNDYHVQQLAHKVRTELLQFAEKSSVLRDFEFYMQTRERWREKLHYIFNLIFVPKVPDWQNLKLPEYLYFLYYVYRPLRLIALAIRLRSAAVNK